MVDVRIWMTRNIMSAFLALGVLGNIINICMFTRKGFRRSSCSLYLLAVSIVNIFNVAWGIFPALYILNNIDPSTYSYIYCKLRLYTIHTLLMISRSLMVFACVDRYAVCSQSVRLRFFRELKNAIRIIIANIFIWPILTIHILILQDFSSTKCFMSGPYVLIYGLYSNMAAGTLPPLLMTIFSVLTIRYRHQLRRRLSIRRRDDRQNHSLVVMLSSEVIVYVVTTSLYPAITLYLAITNNRTKSVESLQIETFVNFLGGSFLIYLNSAAGFYVYFLVSKRFRKECILAIKHLLRKLIRRTNRLETRVIPAHNTLHHPNHI